MVNIAPKFMVAKCSFFVSKMYLGVTFWEYNPLLKYCRSNVKGEFKRCKNDTFRFFLDLCVDY